MLNIPLEVKEAIKKGTYRKNYRIIVLKTDESGNEVEDFTISNDNLIAESVNFDERMCSGDRLTFGLCEGTLVQFHYFNKPNITGKRVHIYLDAEYPTENGTEFYPIPMGFFKIEECSLNFENGITKATGYNKLKNDYLDVEVADRIKEIVANGEFGKTSVTMQHILDDLLKDRTISPKDYYSYTAALYFGVSSGNPIRLSEIGENNYGTGKYQVIIECNRSLRISSKEELSPNEYYRIKYKAKPFFDFIYDVIYPNMVEKLVYYKCDTSEYARIPLDKDEAIKRLGIYFVIEFEDGTYKRHYVKSDEEEITTDWYTSVKEISLTMPTKICDIKNYTDDFTEKQQKEAQYNYDTFVQESKAIELHKRILTEVENSQWESNDVDKWENVTLRELQSAVFELNAEYGKLDRETDKFAGIELNYTRLLPSDSLYPSDNLKPVSIAEKTSKSVYEKLWTDSGGVRSFRYLIIDYKTKDEKGNETVKTIQRTINTHGTDNYNLTQNWLLLNVVWTEEAIEEHAQNLINKIKDIRWFPFEMWASGMPWIECGDEIEVTNNEGTYVSYVLKREFKGIQNLTDTLMNGNLDIF